VLPAPADVGFTVSVGTVSVNVALATFPAASVTVTVFVAVAVIGTANVGEIAPAPLVVVALKVIAAPLKVAVTVLDAAKPVPAIVTVVPLMPNAGVRVIAGCTVMAFWTDRPVFPSVNVSRYVPANNVVGTMNHVVDVNAPVPVLDIVVGPISDDVIRLVLLNVAPVIADNPVTDTVTLLPDTAVVGAVSVGALITVSDASAVSVPAIKRNV
jgi:hypothetical protein